MPRVVAIISQKGGCGKSTIARHGSVLLPRCGLLDLDPQGTSRRWVERRRAAGLVGPGLVTAAASQVPQLIARLDADWLIVDTPPSHDDTRAIRAAAAAADLVLVPVRPTPDDLEVLGATLDLLDGRRAAFVLSMANPRATLTQRARAALEAVGTVAPVAITNRVAYPEAAEDGSAVTESDPRGPAADEMRRLWSWVTEAVQDGKHGSVPARKRASTKARREP
jgi:chromosome partitioning protein